MDEQAKIPPIESYDIDHLGIVAGIIDEIGLIEQIDRLLGTHEQEHLSSGQLIKAMILNGLGFVSAPLYLFQEFFEGKATEHLIAPGVKPEHLNDDKLGRVLDKLFGADLTKVFVNCAMKAASRYGVLERSTSVHLDSTSFHLHGDYETEREEEEPEAAISITHGYSRDQRPDLKQFIVELMVSGDGDVPLFCRIADGNEADKAVFARLIQDFRSRVDLDALFVADSALYSADSLKRMSDLKWLTRVPLTLAEAERVLSEIEEDAFEESALSGYRIAEVGSAYAGIPQRWLIVESGARRKGASEQMERRLLKSEKQLQKRLKKLKKEDFECEADALKAASTFAEELRHHKLTQLRLKSGLRHDKPGRPAKDASPRKVYSVVASLERDEAALAKARQRSGRFILATNAAAAAAAAAAAVLEEERYTNDELLKEYKAQQSAERGFRFLKDPLFFTSSIFVKTPERVAALAMVMGLCLLVYTLGQRALREAIEAAGATIRHQTGKQTARPTLRWVFQLFQAVHLLKIGEVKRISNLSEERATILGFLGPSTQRYYLLL
jgi:transposase